jgi:hypothetical protein
MQHIDTSFPADALVRLRQTISRHKPPKIFGCTAEDVQLLVPHLTLERVQEELKAGARERRYFYGPATKVAGAVLKYCVMGDQDGKEIAVYRAGVRFLDTCANRRRVSSGSLLKPEDPGYADALEAATFAEKHYGDQLVRDAYQLRVQFSVYTTPGGDDKIDVYAGLLLSWEDLQKLHENMAGVEALDANLIGWTHYEHEAQELDYGCPSAYMTNCGLCGGWLVGGSCQMCRTPISATMHQETHLALPLSVASYLKFHAEHTFKRDPRLARVRQIQHWCEQVVTANYAPDDTYEKPTRTILMDTQ